MTEQIQEMQRQIVAAVQQELTRFSGDVATNLQHLRDEVVAGTAARTDLERQVQALAGALEQSQNANAKYQQELQQVLEARLNEFNAATKRRHEEMNTRLGRVVDDANVGITAAVESAARPVLKQLELRQESVEAEVRGLDGSLRKFDEQAGKMVTHINSVTAAIDQRLEGIAERVNATFDERISTIMMRVDEVSASVARQQAEVSNIVGNRVDASEERTSERLRTLETRLNDEIGQRVADIDAHVGRIGAGLDDAVLMLSDRISKADGRFTDIENDLAGIREDIKNVDAEAIDDIKDRVSSALGQAELVRIEMDRFQVTIHETLDTTNERLVEIETTVQDQHLDVEAAVQLERLEEVERAVLMLDPDIIRARRDEPEPVVDEFDDRTVAMERPAATTPVVPMLDRLDSSANAPLAPPTAEHTSGPALTIPALSTSVLEPPVAR